MSDSIQHECGLAFIRLLKPFSYYHEKYGSVLYGLNKLYLLMEKQHNRGQDGAGIATVKLNVTPGYPFMYRLRSIQNQAIADIFSQISAQIEEVKRYHANIDQHPEHMKGHIDYLGELMLGHLRYGTQGKNVVESCHPYIKCHTKPVLNLALAGNFNLVNRTELFDLIGGERPAETRTSDLAAMLDLIYHFLRVAVEKNGDDIQVAEILKKCVPLFDGGFTFGGLVGNGSSFVVRDPHGIRPAYYYADDEVVVAASERAAIRTVFNVKEHKVLELMPGNALITKKDGAFEVTEVAAPAERKACSFERIYFSRGSDEKIYQERKALGYHLSKKVLESVEYDLKNTIFSFIPNTAETAFYGMVKGAEDYLNQIKVQRIMSWKGNYDEEKLAELVNRRIRMEKIAIKDVKLRTFITEDASRNEMVQHVYDVTYGTVRKNTDTLVVIDDSIVRGTTLRESIVKMLARLEPKKIIIVSSAPQIRYPDCYGIDMSRMNEFVAFRAARELLLESGRGCVLQELLQECKSLNRQHQLHTKNLVKEVYRPFTAEEISDKVAQLVTPPEVKIPVRVIYQTIEDLHECCPTNTGDWYFTGDYPTPGGIRVVNTAFINFMEGRDQRSY